jgi:hypothetical protein
VTPEAALSLGFLPGGAQFAMASSRVAAVPFVTFGIAGTMEGTDKNQRSSGGRYVNPAPRTA